MRGSGGGTIGKQKNNVGVKVKAGRSIINEDKPVGGKGKNVK